MLASESSNPQALIIGGWLTIQAARAWSVSGFRLLTVKAGQYGHEKRCLLNCSKEIRSASTVRKPTDAALRLARSLLDGNVKPLRSMSARDLRPSSRWARPASW